MKFIISWVVWVLVQTPCPEQKNFGNGYDKYGSSCAVFHGKYVSIRKEKIFNDRDSAKVFYETLKVKPDTTSMLYQIVGRLSYADSLSFDSAYIKK